MALIPKLKRILNKEFPPPAKISLKDDDGIVGVVTSARFRNMENIDRQQLLHEVLAHGLTPEEERRILVIVAVTPEEETAHTATD